MFLDMKPLQISFGLKNSLILKWWENVLLSSSPYWEIESVSSIVVSYFRANWEKSIDPNSNVTVKFWKEWDTNGSISETSIFHRCSQILWTTELLWDKRWVSKLIQQPHDNFNYISVCSNYSRSGALLEMEIGLHWEWCNGAVSWIYYVKIFHVHFRWHSLRRLAGTIQNNSLPLNYLLNRKRNRRDQFDPKPWYFTESHSNCWTDFYCYREWRH